MLARLLQHCSALSNKHQGIKQLYCRVNQNSNNFAYIRRFSTGTMTSTTIPLGLCQVEVGMDKAINLKTAENAVRTVASRGAKLISLPECFNAPYGTQYFEDYAEVIPKKASELSASEHPSTFMLSNLAKELKVFLIGGSIPELDEESKKLYNTSVVFNPDGEIVTTHRKIHLFDISIPGGITFMESETLSPGNKITTFDTPWCKVGLAICYDMRFAELGMVMAHEGCKLLMYPGAFNTVTGPVHWELLQRARALDNQVFVATVSPARSGDGYQAWGHSTVVDPWGEVIATTAHAPALLNCDVNLARVEQVRGQVPIKTQVRTDLYNKASSV